VDQLLSEPPACIREAGTWCQQVFDWTHNNWLAASASWIVAKPFKILLILIIAFLIRWVVRKLIDRLTTAPKDGSKLPALLRPLRDRAPEVLGLGEAAQARRRQRAKTIGSVLKSMSTFLIFGLAVIQILAELGINLGPLIASAGVVGVALGFGAQNLVKDFLSGMFMMIEDQYGVGDVVDVGSATGTVETVGLRITTLRDGNGTVWYVRNGEVLRVGNSSQGFAIAVVDVPLSYTTDVDQATQVITEAVTLAASKEPLSNDILEAPEVLGVESVTPAGIELRVTAKVRPGKQWSAQRVLRASTLAALEEAGLGHFSD